MAGIQLDCHVSPSLRLMVGLVLAIGVIDAALSLWLAKIVRQMASSNLDSSHIYIFALLFGLFIIMVQGYGCWRIRHAHLARRSWRLIVEGDGQALIQIDASSPVRVGLGYGSCVAPGMMLLRWQVSKPEVGSGAPCRLDAPILQDSVGPGEFRRLAVWANWLMRRGSQGSYDVQAFSAQGIPYPGQRPYGTKE